MKSQQQILKILDILTIFAGFILLASFLTNFIPLMEMFGAEELKSKSRYALILRLSAILFFIPLLGIYFFRLKTFFNLKVIRWGYNFCSRRTISVLIVLTGVFFLNGFIIGLVRHQALETRAFDLGIFVQAVWNTLQGDFLFSSIKNNICLLGDHFAPLLVLLVPFYAAAPYPETLLAIQAFATAACIPLVYLTGIKAGLGRGEAVFFAFLFFLYAPARNTLRSDFHPEVLVEPLMFAAFLFLITNRIKLFILSLLMIVAPKENMSGITFILGFYAFFFQKRRLLGSAVMMLSVFYLWIITNKVIPAIGGAPYLYQGFYARLLEEPARILPQLFGPGAWEYVLKLFSPLLFLSFLHPAVLLTLPVLAQNLLSENEVTRSFNYHYTVGLTAFVFISAIFGWKNLFARWPKLKEAKVFLVIVIAFMSLLRYGPSEYYHIWKSRQNIVSATEELRREMGAIDSRYSVLTHNNLIPQAINRKFIYQFEYNESPTKADMILELQPDYVVFARNFWEPNTLPFEETLQAVKALGYEEISAIEETFYLYRKK